MTPNFLNRSFILLSAILLPLYSSFGRQLSDALQTSGDNAEAELIERVKLQPLHGLLAVNFSFARPQGDFRRTLDSIGKTGPILGFSIEGGYCFDPIPVVAGVGVDLLFNGRDEKIFNKWSYYPDTVIASNMLAPINMFIRFQPSFDRIVEPYAEILGGLTIINASDELRPILYGRRADNNETSVSWNYGFGAGINIRLVDFIELPNARKILYLTMSARYSTGSETSYFIANYDDTLQRVNMTSIRSKTDLFYFKIGLNFRI